jgi:hypothetical protein
MIRGSIRPRWCTGANGWRSRSGRTGGRWRIARKAAGDRIISTVDPEARHTRKSPEACRDGYRAHVAGDPDTGIITDEKLRQDYSAYRPRIERAIAQVATWRGRRLKLRYRGVTKNHAWLKRRAAAVNLRTSAAA